MYFYRRKKKQITFHIKSFTLWFHAFKIIFMHTFTNRDGVTRSLSVMYWFSKEIREDNLRLWRRRVHEDASQGMYMSKIEIFFFTARILQNQRMLCCLKVSIYKFCRKQLTKLANLLMHSQCALSEPVSSSRKTSKLTVCRFI
jgi:hypothetical protein